MERLISYTPRSSQAFYWATEEKGGRRRWWCVCVWIVRMDGVHLLRICTFNIPLKGLQTSVYQTGITKYLTLCRQESVCTRASMRKILPCINAQWCKVLIKVSSCWNGDCSWLTEVTAVVRQRSQTEQWLVAICIISPSSIRSTSKYCSWKR